jgi:excisionase family DNA binding protein
MITNVKPAQLLTVREVADRLGVHEQTVRRKIHSGVLPAVRLGGYGRVSRVRGRDALGRVPAHAYALVIFRLIGDAFPAPPLPATAVIVPAPDAQPRAVNTCSPAVGVTSRAARAYCPPDAVGAVNSATTPRSVESFQMSTSTVVAETECVTRGE